jgi:hypothetical protein
MRQTRPQADEFLAKVAALDAVPETSTEEPAPAERVHPHKTKAVARENAMAFRSLLGS